MKILQSSVFRALCAMVVGVLLLKFPRDGVTWLTMAIGALFLLSGIIALIAYWQARRHASDYTITDQQGRIVSGGQPTFPIVGAGSVILGLVLVLSPNAFINGLMYMRAVILILGGITQLTALIAARRLGSVPFGYWVTPSLILLVGLFVIFKPMESTELPMMILGWCSLLYGIIELINALKIYRLRKSAEATAQSQATSPALRKKDGYGAEEISSELADAPSSAPSSSSSSVPSEIHADGSKE